MENNILIIIGMHRSGTSLTSNWLQSCGLNIGNYVSGKETGNIKGHFEDKDFQNFHNEILTSNNVDYLVQPDDIIELVEQNLLKAKYIVEYKSKLNNQWGWKEPRTCLFVNSIYKKLIPEAKYLILYRDFNSVVDSLYRRDLKIIKNRIYFPRGYKPLFKFKKNKTQAFNKYLGAWIRYNEEILKLIETTEKSHFLVVNSDSLVQENKKVFNKLKDDWHFNIEYKDISNSFEKSLYNKSQKTIKFDSSLLDKAKKIESKFHSLI